mmetsp:Transcript_24114/g.69596  ORF Transcript_24114/g.69596 Transcript_24114/m.69596 type:complete len:226 (-) Transcript_24114:575-1252(-)
MPAHDSLWMMTGEHPRGAATVVATDEARKAWREPGSLPPWSMRPACRPAPNCTPAVSNRATTRSARATHSSFPESSQKAWKSSACSGFMKLGNAKTALGGSVSPITHDVIVTNPIPMTIEPLTLNDSSTAIRSTPLIASHMFMLVRSPSVTKVCGDGTTTPAKRRPIKAWKSPMATVRAFLMQSGQSAWTALQRPVTERRANVTPCTSTATRAAPGFTSSNQHTP